MFDFGIDAHNFVLNYRKWDLGHEESSAKYFTNLNIFYVTVSFCLILGSTNGREALLSKLIVESCRVRRQSNASGQLLGVSRGFLSTLDSLHEYWLGFLRKYPTDNTLHLHRTYLLRVDKWSSQIQPTNLFTPIFYSLYIDFF